MTLEEAYNLIGWIIVGFPILVALGIFALSRSRI